MDSASNLRETSAWFQILSDRKSASNRRFYHKQLRQIKLFRPFYEIVFEILIFNLEKELLIWYFITKVWAIGADWKFFRFVFRPWIPIQPKKGSGKASYR